MDKNISYNNSGSQTIIDNSGLSQHICKQRSNQQINMVNNSPTSETSNFQSKNFPFTYQTTSLSTSQTKLSLFSVSQKQNQNNKIDSVTTNQTHSNLNNSKVSKQVNVNINHKKRKRVSFLIPNKKRYLHEQSFHPFDEKIPFLNGGYHIDLFDSLPDTFFEDEKQESTKFYKKSQLKITYINIPCSVTRRSTLDPYKYVTITSPDTDIFCFSEIYSKKDLIPPIGYSFYYNKSDIITTAILVKDKLNKYITILDVPLNISGIKIKTGPKKSDDVNILSVYRSPSCEKRTGFFKNLGFTGIDHKRNFHDNFLDEIFKFDQEEYTKQKTMIIGDLNWASHKKFSNSRFYERKFQEKLKSSNFKNIAGNLITFIPNHGKATSIDAILINKNMSYSNLENNGTKFNFISDHFSLNFFIDYNFERPPRKWITVRRKFKSEDDSRIPAIEEKLFKFYDDEKIMEKITKDTSFKDPDSICQLIFRKFSEIVESENQPITFKTKTQGKNIQETELFKSLKSQANAHFIESKKKGLNVKKDQVYKKIRRRMEIERRKMIKNYWKNKISHDAYKKKLNWSYLEQYKNGNRNEETSITANQFANHFHKLSMDFTPISNDDFKGIKIAEKSKFEFKLPITLEGDCKISSLTTILKNCENSEHSAGLDGINLALLKKLKKDHLKPLLYVINCCFYNGKYLEDFRNLKCFPVFKRGDKDQVKNYRPIHVAPTLVNIIEKIICLQMSSFWEEKGLLDRRQFGFRKGHSVGLLVNEARRYIKRMNKKYVCCILTDLSNAFGAVDIHIIMKRLAPYCSEQSLKILRSFLIQAKVTVITNNQKSKTYHVASRGYSQGSNLSPFLFTILMKSSHDMPEGIDSFSFADDDNIIITADTAEELQEKSNLALRHFHKFCKIHNIKLNMTKTYYTITGNFQKEELENFKISSDGQEIKKIDQMNMLGLDLSPKLNFEPHTESIENYTKNQLGLITNFSRVIGSCAIKMMVNANVHGKFNHGSAYMQEFKPQEYFNTQRHVNKMINDKMLSKQERESLGFRRESQEILLKKCNLMNLQNLHRKNQMSRMNSCLKNFVPIWETFNILKQINLPNQSFLKSFEKRNGPKMQFEKSMGDTAPNIWVKEFNSLPPWMRKNFASNRSSLKHSV